jgi:hypothetical protein
MYRRGLLLGAVTVLALAGATLAQAAASKHHVNQTAKLVTVSLIGNYPNPGSASVDAGLVSGSLGSGAASQKVKITAHPTATTYKFKTTSTAFYAHGSITSAITGTATVQSNGSVKLVGKGRYIGGTDTYRGAHGSFTLSGTIPPSNPNKPTPAVAHATGTISY